MKRSPDVVYFFEHAARELDVACAVACLLREKGIHTTVVQWPHGFHRVAAQPAPKVVALPFCYSERSFRNCLIEWRTSTYFNLSWEQLFYSGNEKAKSPSGAFALRHVIHHSWSDFYAKWLNDRGVPLENIFVNGHPAYALYGSPYRTYFAPRENLAERYGLSTAKRWIFFPENYNWAFYSPETLRQFIEAGQNPSDIAEMKAFCDLSLRKTLEWCAELARTGRAEVIIRPRPATRLLQFSEFVESVLGTLPAGLHIVQEGTVREWILASEAVVSSHSTTLIEASLAGKPQFMLAPEQMPASLAVDWHELVQKVRSGGELIEACLEPTDSSQTSPLRQWAERRLLGRGDPVAGLADRLSRLALGELPVPSTVARGEVTPPGRVRLPRGLLFEARRVLRRGQRRRPSQYIEPEHLPDLAGEREVESRIARWKELLLPTADRAYSGAGSE